jgi:branched-chain amino acid transport system ATP-binding protein
MSAVATEPLLRIDGVACGYGDLRVLHGISLDVAPGTIELVLGRNGVGKTTLLSAVAGLIPLDEGQIEVEGKAIGKRPAYRRAQDGVALVQEGKRVFRGMSVFDNLVLGAFSRRLKRSERRAFCDALLEDFPMLQSRLEQTAGSLSGGQQQMLAIAQALASEPRVLLLDEPSAGLAPSIVSEVFSQVRRLREGGLTVVLVEQLAEQGLEIADHVTVIDDGRIVAAGEPAEFADQRALQDAYFGAG